MALGGGAQRHPKNPPRRGKAGEIKSHSLAVGVLGFIQDWWVQSVRERSGVTLSWVGPPPKTHWEPQIR